MAEFRFYDSMEVRYGDLDPQGHLNNAKYLTFMEQARIHYLQRLGLWPGGSFLDVGIILAEARLTFLAPVLFGQLVRVRARVSRLGNKSFDMLYSLVDETSGQEHATGTSVLVTYDYHRRSTIAIPEHWRQAILEFEDLK